MRTCNIERTYTSNFQHFNHMQITQQSDDWRLQLNDPSLCSASIHSSINAPANVANRGGGPGSFSDLGIPPAQQHQLPGAFDGPSGGPLHHPGLALEPSALSLAPAMHQQSGAHTQSTFQTMGMGAGSEKDAKLSMQEALRELVRFYVLLHT